MTDFNRLRKLVKRASQEKAQLMFDGLFKKITSKFKTKANIHHHKKKKKVTNVGLSKNIIKEVNLAQSYI